MNRYDIALKKPVPKRYVRKFLTKLKYWWSVTSANIKNILRLILKRPSSNNPQINYPVLQGTTGVQGLQGLTGYGYGHDRRGVMGYTGIQGTTGIQGITGTGYNRFSRPRP